MRLLKILLTILLLACSVAQLHAGVDRAIKLTVKTEQGEVLPLYADSYALVIGASDYSSGWPKLPGVKKDVVAVRDALQKKGFGVTAVLDPTRKELIAAIEKFINQHGAEVNNRLMIYFAGHGHTVKFSYGEEMGFIVPVDAPPPSRSETSFIAKSLDMQQIEVFAKRIQAKHAMFVFDSCFSGSIFALSRAVPENINYKTAMPVRQFITSGGADEQVPDESIFRRQFISGIEGEADVNNDGYITGTEFGEYLQNSVVNYSKGSQHPQYGKIRNPNLDKGDFVFINPERPVPIADASVPITTAPHNIELAYWNSIKDSGNRAMYEAYLSKYPSGEFVELAKLQIDTLDKVDVIAPEDGVQSDERIYWESIRDSNNAQLYQAYLNKYPQGTFADLARIKLQEAQRHATDAKTVTSSAGAARTIKAQPVLFKAAIFPVHKYRDEVGGKAHLTTVQGALQALYREQKFNLSHSYYRLKNAVQVETIAKRDVDLFVWTKESWRSPAKPDINFSIRYARSLGVDAVLLYGVDAQKNTGKIDCYLIDTQTGEVRRRLVTTNNFNDDGATKISQITGEMLNEFIKSPRVTTKIFPGEQQAVVRQKSGEQRTPQNQSPAQQPNALNDQLRNVQDAIKRFGSKPPPGAPPPKYRPR